MVYSWAECVFILEHYFAMKLFAVVREAFSYAYPDKEVLNKTTLCWMVTKFQVTGSVCVSSRRWWTSAVKMFCKFFFFFSHTHTQKNTNTNNNNNNNLSIVMSLQYPIILLYFYIFNTFFQIFNYNRRPFIRKTKYQKHPNNIIIEGRFVIVVLKATTAISNFLTTCVIVDGS
jgi:hypothetical protein